MSEAENAQDQPGETPAPSDPKPAEPAPEPAEPKSAEPKPAAPASTTGPDHPRPHRHVRNYLLQPPFQVQLAIYNCFLALAFAVSLLGVLHVQGKRIRYRMDVVGVPAGLRDALDSALSDSVVYMVMLGIIFVAACVTITIVLTHRLVGPAYAFRRQINEMVSGNYEARIHLRKEDAFTEVAEDLNRLAETLEREHGGLNTRVRALESEPD